MPLRMFPSLFLSLAGVMGLVSVASAQNVPATKIASVRAQGAVQEIYRPLAGELVAAGLFVAVSKDDSAARLCAASVDLKIALGEKLDTSARALCQAAGRGAVFQKPIGQLMVVPVAQPGQALSLTSQQIFAAVTAQSAPNTANTRAKWKDIDPALPDAPIRILLPAIGTPESQVLQATILLKGCVADRGARLPVSAADRLAECSKTRGDSVVTRASASTNVASWLQSNGPGAVALVGYGRLMQEQTLSAFVILDGFLPTVKARTTADYPAVMPVYFVATHRGRNPVESRDNAVALADAVLSEASIGPQGRAALAGLAPLSAEDRVALRRDFAKFLSSGGLWE